MPAIVVGRLRLIVPVCVMMKMRREFHTIISLPVTVLGFVVEIPANGIRNPCLDPFDQVVRIDRGIHAVPIQKGQRDDSLPPLNRGAQSSKGATFISCDERWIPRHGRLQEAVRREPDI